ncbi:MAG: carbohydrate-binding family 9-like protein [Chloroflexi bacterium]|nr:carbohydrate-binding family 9-like protein [Chloroflexota bacterium]
MMYLVRRARALPALVEQWNSQAWQSAEVAKVSHFRLESSTHRPRTQVKVLHDGSTIAVYFQVQDRFIRSVQTEYLAPVCTDSCVEWFAQPKPDKGYINFELNCGGTLHCSYIEDPTRIPGGFRRFAYIPAQLASGIQVAHSMPAVVNPEITDAMEWTVQLRAPLSLFEVHVGRLGNLSGQRWMANFYKCGDQTSHPHWAAWSPVQELNFHRPQDFAPIVFE